MLQTSAGPPSTELQDASLQRMSNSPMRFRDHLADLPKEVPGGQKAPEVYDKSRLLKLEEESRRLREMIDKKEDEKRQKLREWDGLERDAGNAQLKTELAETSLRELEGEGNMSSAF